MFMWHDYDLPETVRIGTKDYKINSDWRQVIDIIIMFNNPDLTEYDKMIIGIELLFEGFEYDKATSDEAQEAIQLLHKFINGSFTTESKDTGTNKPVLVDWEKDLPLIISAINANMGCDIRAYRYWHWWSFLSAYAELGECTFATFVRIRQKKAKGKKLEKYEEEIYRENIDRILIKRRVDSTTQDFINQILGR